MHSKSHQQVAVVKLLSRTTKRGGQKLTGRPPGMSCDQGSAYRQCPTVFVVDDNCEVRQAIKDMLEDEGYAVETFPDCPSFRESYESGRTGCLLVDAVLPGMSGIDLIERLTEEGHGLPAIVISGNAAVSMAVEAMKAGAVDFIEKPASAEQLLDSIDRALAGGEEANKLARFGRLASARLSTLTLRQRQVLDLVLDGQPSKNIAADLGISQRTVENHRAAIMRRTSCKSIPALMNMAFCARCTDGNADWIQRTRPARDHSGTFAS